MKKLGKDLVQALSRNVNDVVLPSLISIPVLLPIVSPPLNTLVSVLSTTIKVPPLVAIAIVLSVKTTKACRLGSIYRSRKLNKSAQFTGVNYQGFQNLYGIPLEVETIQMYLRIARESNKLNNTGNQQAAKVRTMIQCLQTHDRSCNGALSSQKTWVLAGNCCHLISLVNQ